VPVDLVIDHSSSLMRSQQQALKTNVDLEYGRNASATGS